LGYVLAFVPVLSAADPPKGPDFSKYAYVADVVGEIVKADDKKLTLRVTWNVTQTQGGGGRPRLSGNNRNFHNPYAMRGNQPRVTVKQEHHDYELEYVPESVVRTKVLPPKLDEKGKRVNYTTKELEELRGPASLPAYAASTSDLTPGTIVDVVIIRDKSVPAAKATEDDLRVKWAVILSHDQNPPKDIAGSKDSKADPKKKN